MFLTKYPCESERAYAKGICCSTPCAIKPLKVLYTWWIYGFIYNPCICNPEPPPERFVQVCVRTTTEERFTQNRCTIWK